MRIAGVLLIAFGLGIGIGACDAEPPRIHVVTSGERMVVRIDAPVASATSERRSLAVLRAGSPLESERVLVDEALREAVVSVPEPGTYELVLRDGSRVVARASVTIERRAAAKEEPPIWYW